MARKKQDPHAWWRKAILVSVTGLVFSLALSALMSLGAALRIAPLMALERAYTPPGERAARAADDARTFRRDLPPGPV